MTGYWFYRIEMIDDRWKTGQNSGKKEFGTCFFPDSTLKEDDCKVKINDKKEQNNLTQ